MFEHEGVLGKLGITMNDIDPSLNNEFTFTGGARKNGSRRRKYQKAGKTRGRKNK